MAGPRSADDQLQVVGERSGVSIPHDALSAGVAGLATGLGPESIAEGIETEEHARLVQGHGWTHGQGSLLGRPHPLEHWLG